VQRLWLCLKVSSVGVTAPIQKTTANVFACNYMCSNTAILLRTAVRDCNWVLDCGLSLRLFFAIAVLDNVHFRDCALTPWLFGPTVQI